MSKYISVVRALSVYTIVAFLPMSLGLVMAPVYTRFLDPGQIGAVNYFTNLSAIFSVMFMFGIDSSFSIFYFSKDPDFRNKGEVLSNALALQLLMGLLMAAIFIGGCQIFYPAIVKNVQEFPMWPFYFLAVFNAVLSGVYSILNIYYRDANDQKNFLLLNGGNFLLNIVSAVVIVVFLRRGQVELVSTRVACLVVNIALAALTIRRFSGSVQVAMLKKMFRMSIPMYLYAVLIQVSGFADKFVVEKKFRLDDLGIYSQAAVIAMLPELVLTICGNFFAPQIMRRVNEDFEEENIRGIQTIQKINFMLVMGCVYTLIFVSPFVINIYLGEAFQKAAYFIPIMAYSHIFRLMFINHQPILMARNKTRIFPASVLVSFICSIAFMLLAEPFLGILAIAAALNINRIVSIPIIRYFARKELPIGSGMLLPLNIMGWAGFGLIILSYCFPDYSRLLASIPFFAFLLFAIYDISKNRRQYSTILSST